MIDLCSFGAVIGDIVRFGFFWSWLIGFLDLGMVVGGLNFVSTCW